MFSRLLLFATPLAVLLAVLQVPANSVIDAKAEVELAPVSALAVTEQGDFAPQQVQLAEFETPSRETPPSETPSAESQTNITASDEDSPPTSFVMAASADVQPVAITNPQTTPVASIHEDIRQLRALSERYWNEPDQRKEFRSELFQLAHQVYFDPKLHYVTPHVVQSGELLATIAQQYHVPWEYLARLNQISPMRLRAGTVLKVIPGPFHAIIERSRYRLTIHAHGYVVAAFDVGLGKPNADGQTSTPTGQFQIADRIINPTWYGPDGTVAADDPANPLGEYWLGLKGTDGRPTSLGIHGTLAPHTIGQNASNGCVRMRSDDIEAVFQLLSTASIVEIRD